MALAHCASSGTGSAAFGWIFCPQWNKTHQWILTLHFKKFQMHDLRSSLEFRRAAEKSFKQLRWGFDPIDHYKVASTLWRESNIPPSLPLHVFWKTSRCCLPHLFWHSCVSSGWLVRGGFVLIRYPESPVVKTTFIFPYHCWQSKGAEPYRMGHLSSFVPELTCLIYGLVGQSCFGCSRS